jgi:hypothetical protein
MRNSYKISVGKREGKGPFEKSGRGWEKNKIDSETEREIVN